MHNQTSPLPLPLRKKPANIGGGASTGYKSTAFTPAAYREAFKVLDPDGDGELTTEELLRGLEIAGQTNVTDSRKMEEEEGDDDDCRWRRRPASEGMAVTVRWKSCGEIPQSTAKASI